jgi:hypothetical protein
MAVSMSISALPCVPLSERLAEGVQSPRHPHSPRSSPRPRLAERQGDGEADEGDGPAGDGAFDQGGGESEDHGSLGDCREQVWE